MTRGPKIIFHIGLHKTATTTFQRQIFPACKDLHYLTGIYDVDKFVHAATTQDPIYFDAAFHRQQMSKYINSGKPTLISKEALSGAPLAGLGKRNLDHRSAILENLQAAIPEARIILVLRRQDHLAISLYRQYLKNGGTEQIRDFFGLPNDIQPIFPLDRFRFHPYVDKTISMFPAGVLVLIFEEFVTNRQIFLDRLANFLGISIPEMIITISNETRLGSIGLETSRVINRFFRNRFNPNGLLPKIMPAVHYRWPVKGQIKSGRRIRAAADEIFSRVKEDNRQMELQHRIGLEEFGYF